MITIFIGLTTLFAMFISFLWKSDSYFNIFLKILFTVQWLFGFVIFAQLMGWFQ